MLNFLCFVFPVLLIEYIKRKYFPMRKVFSTEVSNKPEQVQFEQEDQNKKSEDENKEGEFPKEFFVPYI